MSAASGIIASQDLKDTWANAATDSSIRFIKVVIEKESLVPAGTWPKEKPTLEAEFARINGFTEDNIPSYVLARLDGSSDWLFIAFVPDTAKVRDKMLYASSRNALTKSLGGERFKDTIFATSKSDLTPEGYAAHKRHLAAPKPLSPREQELERVREAEREASEAWEGSRARKAIVTPGPGLKWTPEVEEAVKGLSSSGSYNLAVIGVSSDESLTLQSTKKVDVDTLISAIPTDDPSYTIFAPSPSTLIFIYACPSQSKIKLRMIYSSGITFVVKRIQEILSPATLKRLETSDPSDLDMGYVKEIVSTAASSAERPSVAGGSGGGGLDRGEVDVSPGFTPSNHPLFAKPRGPIRRR